MSPERVSAADPLHCMQAPEQWCAAVADETYQLTARFGIDEDEATLGEQVVLAPFLEPRRAEIIANLKPID